VQLRRLELVGFKTFVDRTELEFHPGITAIVGPNGSGKSNIFDGIRWALGETNARLLRGARMEDVIFSGSATRRPTSMAQVALTFDNSAGLLPVTFNEVTVARTVTRGGDGEYALNSVDCRLRDVQMLFLGTGLGGRSYALIGQGEVEAVLRAGPLERRHWLEEAAGLARHKRQRVEAERRLERAQAHLDRLTDLVEELAQQQAALAEQAEAAARHRAYTDELRDLEMALFADEARRLLGAVTRLTGQLDADRGVLSAAERRVVEAGADVAMTEAHLTTTTAAWEAGQQSLLDGAEALRGRAGDVQALDGQAETLRTRAADLDAELARLAQARTALAEDAAALEREAGEGERRGADLRREVDAAEAALVEATQDADEAEVRTAAARAEAVEAARALSQTRNDLAVLQGRAEALAQAIDAAAHKAAALDETAAHLAATRVRAHQACDDARAALATRENEVMAAAAALEAARATAAAAAEAAHAAELGQHRLAVRLASLEEAAAQFLGFEESTRAVLLAEAAGPGRFGGLRGAVADLLRVPEAYRPAVAAALGSRLHCLVVDDREAMRAVLAYARGETGGRATVLALDDARPRPAAPVGAGVRAIDVVTADAALRPALEALLGDVVMVDDLDRAWALRAAGMTSRIATVDGALLAADGVVSLAGGATGEASPLGRPQTITELRAGAAEAAAAAAAARRHRAAATEELRGAEDGVRRAQAGRAAAAAVLADRLQALARAEAEMSRAIEQQTAQASEVRAAAETQARLQAEIDRLEADAGRLEAEVKALEGHAAAVYEESRRTAAARADAAEALAARRVASATAQAALEATRVRLVDRSAALADLDARTATLAAGAGRVANELEEVVRRRADAATAYDRLAARQTSTRLEVERLAVERARLRGELAQRQAEHADATEAARAAEAAVHRTELRAAQAEAELGAAAARLREQYGIDLDAAASRRLEGSRDDARRRAAALRDALGTLGAVNLLAIDEHAAVASRLAALRGHVDDLGTARDALRGAITHINAQLRVRFAQTFEDVNREFGRLFQRLFDGGEGTLELVDDGLGGEPGLEVTAQLPGKRRRSLVALSGGERALVALTLIFAMLRVHPSPFCIFDEVEATLDDANTARFTDLLRDLAERTQVLIITHNKGTMAAADILYGVTMQEPGLSSIVSVRLVSPSGNGDRPEEPPPRGAVAPEDAGRRAVALPAE
jgi:chromosome segregation protein